MKTYTSTWLLQDLQLRCSVANQRSVAQELAVSPSFLNDVLKGRRALTDNLARAMGYVPQESTYTKEPK